MSKIVLKERNSSLITNLKMENKFSSTIFIHFYCTRKTGRRTKWFIIILRNGRRQNRKAAKKWRRKGKRVDASFSVCGKMLSPRYNRWCILVRFFSILFDSIENEWKKEEKNCQNERQSKATWIDDRQKTRSATTMKFTRLELREKNETKNDVFVMQTRCRRQPNGWWSTTTWFNVDFFFFASLSLFPLPSLGRFLLICGRVRDTIIDT